MSITNRYRTSILRIRSLASLICRIGNNSTSAAIRFAAQKFDR